MTDKEDNAAGIQCGCRGPARWATGMTVDPVAAIWSPYLTTAEGIKIACQSSYNANISKFSCCAA